MRISTAGGRAPRWRGDGKELFYLDAAGRLTAVPVKAPGPEAGFTVGAAEPLFGVNPNETTLALLVWEYDVTTDGKRFLARTGSGEAASSPLVVVTNWQASLKK